MTGWEIAAIVLGLIALGLAIVGVLALIALNSVATSFARAFLGGK